MPQPIPKKIVQAKPELAEKTFNTLLIDGSNLLEISYNGDKRCNSEGKQVGGIFQFLLQIKILLQKGNFDYVYTFWDGDKSGQMRYDLYPLYKANRDKTFDEPNLSNYSKSVNETVRQMMKWAKEKQAKKREENPEKYQQKLKDKEVFYFQREAVMKCLEELFVRQCISDGVEADDFIGYYVVHKKPNERIVILSGDRDLTQLIQKDVIVYCPSPNMKTFLNLENHKDLIGYRAENVLVKKIICGDVSDNIKGIKGVGEETLLKHFPELKEREVHLEEILERSKQMIEERKADKKKPLKWTENIINRVTDGIQGEDIFEINEKIINLRKPLLTPEAVEQIDSMMYAPLDPDGRSLQNLYNIILSYGIDELKDSNKFGNFFIEFKYLIDKEEKFFKRENSKNK